MANRKELRTATAFPGVQWKDAPAPFVSVDPSRCTGCGNCVKVCLGECFTIAGKKATVRSLAFCMECASCWYVCADGAVSFKWPAGGTGFRTNWG